MGEPEFELSGGNLCLDLVNTVEGRPKDTRRDLLRTYRDLVAWGEQAGILDSASVRSLLRAARENPRRGQHALKRAKQLREALFGVLVATEAGAPLPDDALLVVNAAIGRALGALRLEGTRAGFERRFAYAADDLDRVLAPAVLAAVDLLTSEELGRVRVCAAESCDWLFIDRSKNRSRRWCDMKVCGNRAKAQRHYERTRGG